MSLCKDSLKIMKVLEKYDIHPKYFKMNHFIYTLYDKIMGLMDNNIDFKIKKIKESCDMHLKNSNFMSKSIKLYIKEHLKDCYELTYNNNTIIYFTKKNINTKLVIHMFQIIQLIEKIFNHSEYHQKIIFFDTNKKKKFPSTNKVELGPNEVNTGVTFVNDIDQHNKHGCKVILYRKEEVLKVLAHELVHAHLVDFDMIVWKDTVKFSKIFCTKYNVLLNEAYTEWYANIFNIVYTNIACGFGRNELMNMYFNEIKYSIYISKKILNFYNIPSIKTIIKKDTKCKVLFPQQTNIISYYILKNILLIKYDGMNRDINHIVKILMKNMYILDGISDNFRNDNERNSDIENVKNINNRNKILNKYNYNDGNKSLRLCLYELM